MWPAAAQTQHEQPARAADVGLAVHALRASLLAAPAWRMPVICVREVFGPMFSALPRTKASTMVQRLQALSKCASRWDIGIRIHADGAATPSRFFEARCCLSHLCPDARLRRSKLKVSAGLQDDADRQSLDTWFIGYRLSKIGHMRNRHGS